MREAGDAAAAAGDAAAADPAALGAAARLDALLAKKSLSGNAEGYSPANTSEERQKAKLAEKSPKRPHNAHFAPIVEGPPATEGAPQQWAQRGETMPKKQGAPKGAASAACAASASDARAPADPEAAAKRLDRRFVAAADPRFAISKEARKQQREHKEIHSAGRRRMDGTLEEERGGISATASKRQAKLEAAKDAEQRAARAEGGGAPAETPPDSLVLDSRFSRILTERRFLTGRSLSSAKVDKFGRTEKNRRKETKGDTAADGSGETSTAPERPCEELAAKVARRELLQLYASAEEAATAGTPSAAVASGNDDGAKSSSDSESSSSSSDEEDADAAALWDTTADALMSEEVSSRLAIMGLDWEAVQPTDLLLLFQQFLQSEASSSTGEAAEAGMTESGSRVLRVQIYVSEFGKERIELEKIKGPTVDWSKAERLRRKSKGASKAATATSEDAESSDEEQQVSAEQDRAMQEALRKYQVERSRYHYAIAEVDSVTTAKRLYDELDGCDLGFALNGLDLRFVPHTLELPAENLISEATSAHLSPAAAAEAAERLEAASARSSSALKHCKVQLTWDEPPRERTKFLRRKFSAKELEEQDMEAFLASSDSDAENEAHVDEMLGSGVPPSRLSDQPPWKKITEENLASFRQELLGDLADASDPSEPSDAEAASKGSTSGRAFFKKTSHPEEQEPREDEAQTTDEDAAAAQGDPWKARKARVREQPKLKAALDIQSREEGDGEMPSAAQSESVCCALQRGGPNSHSSAASRVFRIAISPLAQSGRPRQAAVMVSPPKAEPLPGAAEEVLHSDEVGRRSTCVEMLARTPGGADKPFWEWFLNLHFDLREERQKKKRSKKATKSQERVQAAERQQQQQPGFKFDFADPRFKRVLQSHDFALDPTNPAFKSSDTTQELLRLRREQSHKHKFKAATQPEQLSEQQHRQQNKSSSASRKQQPLRGLRLI
ncbi:ESF1 homolog [Cyclospora cayetanensis]|uniref:ESF1 homolog n=1 Tax=Cyclospora cayetanensis TaxID=88456 RepID=A0A6P6RW94_9EIME|nr:ESF1 homolog [Cyclospora cayetanensis]